MTLTNIQTETRGYTLKYNMVPRDTIRILGHGPTGLGLQGYRYVLRGHFGTFEPTQEGFVFRYR